MVTLHEGDCIEVLQTVEPESVDMLFADPPFNAGKEYADEFDDKLPLAEYRAWLTKWIEQAERALKQGGTFWLMQDQRHLGYCQMELERLGLEFRNIVSWAYTNPTPASDGFPKTWRPILLFSKGKPNTFDWHADQMGRETLYYNPGRAKTNFPNDLWPDIPKLVGGIFAPPELLRTREGRFAHLAQMPEKLADRAVRIATLPGEIVLDPFMGSGTVGAACKKIGRRYIGIEKSHVYFAMAEKRIKKAALQPSLFTPSNIASTGQERADSAAPVLFQS